MKMISKAVLAGLAVLMMVSVAFSQESVSKGSTEWDNGIIIFKSDDNAFKTRFDVRGFLNGAYFFNDDEDLLSSGTHVRKARFAMKTSLYTNWRVEWDMDVAEGVVEVKDMFIAYMMNNSAHLKIGHFKMPLGLNELMSSRYQTFIERAYPMLAFETDRRFGIEYSRWRSNWNIRAAAFGQTMDGVKNKSKDETGNGVGARLAVAPIKNDNMILHTGLAMVYQRPDDASEAMEFQSEPETKIGDTEILGTGTIFDVKHSLKTGLEGALVYKNFSVQSEYIQTKLSRMNGAKDATLDGGYAFVSWILTGESRPWEASEGEFGQVVPRSNTLGAWELAFRYSHLNLSDADAGVLGGKANNYTVGLNWYANPNIRFMLNYTMVKNSKFATNDGFPGNYDFIVLHFLIMAYF